MFELVYINYFLYIFFIYQSALATRYVYLRYLRNNKRQQISKQIIEKPQIAENKKQVVEFKDKYLEQYDKTQSIVLSEQRLDTLKNTLLFENTPLGNLIMFYDHSRDSFIYYSDNTIPYRFLEVASRHYAVQNNCKSIHINMPEELLDAEKKLEEKKKEEEKKALEKKAIEKENPKKNVFAKLKNYNTGSIKAPNAVTQKSNTNTNGRSMPPSNVKIENTDIIVKERANRYLYDGKLANFQFLKKVTNKRNELSFADFMKMQNLST